MQHPVGYTYNPKTGRAELNDFFAVLLNKVQLVTFPHVVLSAYLTGGAFVVGVVAVEHDAQRGRGAGDLPSQRPGRSLACSWSPASVSPSAATSPARS